MDVIKSDFVRLESDTVASEAADQAEYDKFITASSVDKAGKEKDIEFKTAEKQDKGIVLQDKKEALTKAEDLLATAKQEYDNLKPACIDTGMTYEERKSRRED